MTPLDISDFPTRHNYGLALLQHHVERILADWVGELERRGIAVVRDLHRDEACAVLRDYGQSGGVRY